jgi:chaperonin GroES
MTKIKPLGKRVLVRRSKAESSKGGILLPDSAQETPREGEVIAVGPGESNDRGELQPLSLSIGDRVLFGAYAGTEVKGDDDELLVLSEDDVLGILA